MFYSSIRLLGLIAMAFGSFNTVAFSGAEQLAKYEPADGSIYLGYCASDYWSQESFDNMIDSIHTEVSEKPFLLYSMFVHAKEKGRWNGWEYRKDGPDGKPVHGSGAYLERIRDAGYTPVVAWTWMDWLDHSQSPSLKGLVRGEYDWYLDEWIEGIKKFKDPIFIRLSHEMDGGWYPYSEGFVGDVEKNTAEDYTAYWRYVVDRFRAAGVDNVAWVWCVSGSRQGRRDWVDYYPGDEYVDRLAVDVYSNRDGGTTLLELKEALGDHKPIMVPEGGTEDLLTPFHYDYPGNSAWIEEFYTTILEKMDNQVKAVCWFQWNEHSYLQRDPSQLPAYRSYIEQDAFISELAEGGESYDADTVLTAFDVRVPDVLEMELGDASIINAKVVAAVGKVGCKWSLESGDINGLVLDKDGCDLRFEAKQAGEYTLKFQAWDAVAHSSDYVTVTVGGSTSDTLAPRVQVPSEVRLTLNETRKTVYADIEGLGGRIGGRWSVESGPADGLELVDNLSAATFRGLKVGEYAVKVQFWDQDHDVSSYISVKVEKGVLGSTVEASILAPDQVEIVADGDAYTLETQYVGFKPKGGKWTVEQGPSDGLKIEGKGELVDLRATVPGEYIVKSQAWADGLHVSKHIRVYVGAGE